MRAFGLSVKSALRNPGRTITLVAFCFFATSFVALLLAFTGAVREKTGNAVAEGITGDVQIRSADSTETDMAAQNDSGWYGLRAMSPERVAAVERSAARILPSARIRESVRAFGFASGPRKEEQIVLLGIDPSDAAADYRKAFLLSEGNYLDGASALPLPPVLLTEEQAKALGVRVGDTITVRLHRPDGLSAEGNLSVAGVGNLVLLSLFSYKAGYADIGVLRSLLGLSDGSATEVILSMGKGRDAKKAVRLLASEISAAGIKAKITATEALTRDDFNTGR